MATEILSALSYFTKQISQMELNSNDGFGNLKWS